MPDKVKLEIIKLAEKIKNDSITDEELVEFFNSHRIDFMKTDNVASVKQSDLMNPFVVPTGYRAFLSCSCGSREDSCSEDGRGYYSQFFVNEEGNIFRLRVQK